TNLAVAAAVAPATGLKLSWTDNSASETGFTLQRDISAAFSAPTTFAVGPSAPDANGQGIGWGGTITYNDTAAPRAGPISIGSRRSNRRPVIGIPDHLSPRHGPTLRRLER